MPNHISMHIKTTVSLLMKGKRVNLATTGKEILYTAQNCYFQLVCQEGVQC